MAQKKAHEKCGTFFWSEENSWIWFNHNARFAVATQRWQAKSGFDALCWPFSFEIQKRLSFFESEKNFDWKFEFKTDTFHPKGHQPMILTPNSSERWCCGGKIESESNLYISEENRFETMRWHNINQGLTLPIGRQFWFRPLFLFKIMLTASFSVSLMLFSVIHSNALRLAVNKFRSCPWQ